MSRRALYGLILLGIVYLVRYHWVVGIHWINDDFIFLDHARSSSFLDLWNFEDALGNAYRPLTRNLYFWLGVRLFGNQPAPYHVINLAVGLAGLYLCFLVLNQMLLDGARAITTPGTAAGSAVDPRSNAGRLAEGPALVGACLFAAHPATGTPIAWTCGIQDLLAVTLGLAAILAHLHGRRLLYPLLLAAAILSKETAALLPGLLWLYDLAVRRETLRQATMAQIGAASLLILWAIGNRWLPWNDLGSTIHSDQPGERTLLGRFDPGTVWLTMRSLVLAEHFDAFVWPHRAWETVTLLAGGVGVIAIAARLPWPRRVTAGLLLYAALWSLSGILPLVTVISHFVYYAYYPALGGGLLIVGLLVVGGGRWPRAGHALRIILAAALVVILTAGAGMQHPAAQCDAHNIRRASDYLWQFRADLLRLHPTLPDSTRCYFWNIPPWIGFQLADGPALRVWYDNPTLEGYFLSEYRPHPTRPALFFGYDDRGGLVEITRGRPDPGLAAPSPVYADAHADLGSRLAEEGQVEAAIVEWQKALEVNPGLRQANANLGIKLVELRRFRESLPVLQRSLQLEPDYAEIKLVLAMAQANLGQRQEALTLIRRFLDQAPNSPHRPQALALEQQLTRDLE